MVDLCNCRTVFCLTVNKLPKHGIRQNKYLGIIALVYQPYSCVKNAVKLSYSNTFTLLSYVYSSLAKLIKFGQFTVVVCSLWQSMWRRRHSKIQHESTARYS